MNPWIHKKNNVSICLQKIMLLNNFSNLFVFSSLFGRNLESAVVEVSALKKLQQILLEVDRPSRPLSLHAAFVQQRTHFLARDLDKAVNSGRQEAH
jgi:hypothetical protein